MRPVTIDDRKLFFSNLLYLIAVLDFVHKNLGRLEAWDIVLVNNDGSIARDVTRNFFLPLLVDKTSKPTDVDVLSASHRGLNNIEERFYGMRYIGFIYSGFLCYLSDYVSFGHVGVG